MGDAVNWIKDAFSESRLQIVTRMIERLLLSSVIFLAAISAVRYREQVFFDAYTGWASVVMMFFTAMWVAIGAINMMIEVIPPPRRAPMLKRLLLVPVLLLTLMTVTYFWRALVTAGMMAS